MCSTHTKTTMYRSALIPLLGSVAENKKFYKPLPWSILRSCKVTEQRWCSYLWRPRKWGMFPHEHCRRRQLKPTSRSCSQTGRWRRVLQVQQLQGITHIWCIDVVRAPVQQSSRKRRTQTGNPAARWCPARGVSSNSRVQLQTWEPSQRGEDGEMGWMSQGANGCLYIGGGVRWHLPGMSLSQGGAPSSSRPPLGINPRALAFPWSPAPNRLPQWWPIRG
jgi:hypothetical protein